MYYSQPLKPPCVNTPADSKLVVNNTAEPMQKKSTTIKGKPSVIKIIDASAKETVTYRSAALDLYDFGPWTEGTEEYREVRVPGEKYSGVILDKARNKYNITGTMEAYDSGSRIGRSYDYSYNIRILPIDIRLHSSTYDIIKDLEDGYFLEDYLAKNKEKVYCDNELGQQLILRANAIPTSEIKSFAKIEAEKKAAIENEKRNTAIANYNTVFKLSDDKRHWIEVATEYTLAPKNNKTTFSVVDGYLSCKGLPEKTYKVEKIFGKPVEDFPVRASYECYSYFYDDNEKATALMKIYSYNEYKFAFGFAIGAEDISAILGASKPVYPVNIYMINDTTNDTIDCGNTYCIPVIEQPVIDSYLKVKEFKHNVYAGVDTRYILNHPDYDKELAENEYCYYIFRDELWSINDLLIKRIRTGISKAVDTDCGLTPAMKGDTYSNLWGYRYSLAYNVKSDVFYFVMNKYMFSLNLNHTEEAIYDASNLCYSVNAYTSGISYPIKRIACKPYKKHVNNVWVKYYSD